MLPLRRAVKRLIAKMALMIEDSRRRAIVAIFATGGRQLFGVEFEEADAAHAGLSY